MEGKKARKILIIISIIILILGILAGITVPNEIINSLPDGAIYIDGTDVSGLTEIIGVIGSKILGAIIILFTILIDVFIWIIYGAIVLIQKIINKIKENNF